MTTLAAAQRRMHAALIAPHADPGAAQTLFETGGRLGPAGGLAVYQRGYFLRIAACMREQFPALCHALGRALFDDFVADYIRDCPPERHTLYDLGRCFPGWLEANRPEPQAREAWVDFMIDLARFEYATFAMFDAEGNEGSPFATSDTADGALRLQPAFALGTYGFPVAGYYHAVRRGEAPPLPAPSTSHVALVRTEFVTRTVPLADSHYAFLTAMRAGSGVEAALASASARHGLDPGQTHGMWRGEQGCRGRWIEWGFFIAADPDGHRMPGAEETTISQEPAMAELRGNAPTALTVVATAPLGPALWLAAGADHLHCKPNSVSPLRKHASARASMLLFR
ncbi:DNA-binding domain-containing protein [Sphingomonas sp. HF-S4]|uniref:DNA-binding domain-containing protein n=1 Tax=Sphingomonas agrestis TaxID=3080540 RepID=A0ABU3YCM0_9SPHN|nr:DNA-binding domain-containing protein [Sphingomonas sp. HF-S4]MDV3459138.1 DNA-binding domain-containing protein [Sphingomonas sp. HF-S4]